MASLIYNGAKHKMWSHATLNIDLLADTIKCMLVNNLYAANADNTFADVGGANDPIDREINVTGYTRGFGGAGRKSLASKAVTQNDTDNRAEFDAADLTWTALGIGETIQAAMLIKEITNDAATPLIAYIDFGTGVPTNGGDITIQWGATGILHLT